MTTFATVEDVAAPSAADLAGTCTFVRSFDDDELSQREWDEFVSTVDGDIYMTYDWCRTWWDHYGKGRQLLILVFRGRRGIEGLIPMFIEDMRIGLVKLRIAKVVGADFSMHFAHPLVRPDAAERVFAQTLEQLVTKERCDSIWFGPIAGTYESLASLRSALAKRPALAKVAHDVPMGVHIAFDVPATIAEYTNSLNKKKRGQVRRNMRALEEKYRICSDIVTDRREAEAVFEDFCELHETQWRSLNKLGHFGDWPRSKAFNLSLLRLFSDKGQLRLLRMTADGSAIAYHYGYTFGGRYYWRLPARRTGPEWDAYSLGTVGILQKFEMATQEHLKLIESGIGHYDYKLQWGGKEYNVQSILVSANGMRSRMRNTLLLWVSKALHLLYYRIWFLRLAPKVPRRRRPLWSLWIRTRL